MHRCIALASVLLLAACASAPPAPPPTPMLTHATPGQMVAAIRAAAGRDPDELNVQPLRDPQVEDLREQAQRLEAQRRDADAAAVLDRALAITPDDPALLQERAEAALLLHDGATAERLARKAEARGAHVGPLCRRHWATVEQARLLAGDAPGAADAHARIAACTVAPPPRY
ncbi:MAG: hypothetical protein HOQ02_03975 [Lysobacter sp.]|nr:hypothetical protein [Lysobacter sp.]